MGICQPLVLFEFTSVFFLYFYCSIVDNMNLFMQIILIDMILHKRKAYRHLLFNMLKLGAGDSKAQILFLPWIFFVNCTLYFFQVYVLHLSSFSFSSKCSSLNSFFVLVKTVEVIAFWSFHVVFNWLITVYCLYNHHIFSWKHRSCHFFYLYYHPLESIANPRCVVVVPCC